MMDSTWTRVERELPPEGVVVETISPGGIPQNMWRKGRLWFPDDGSGVYVYYEPEFWRPAHRGGR